MFCNFWKYTNLPDGGEEDVFYDADKGCGNNPQLLGHRQVVEGPQHHHHYPKTEEAVLELFENFVVDHKPFVEDSAGNGNQENL